MTFTITIPDGYLLNNLFQLSDGTWRANLRAANQACDFGEGPTPQAAIDDCDTKLWSQLTDDTPAAHIPLAGHLGINTILSDLLNYPIPRPIMTRKI